jgi:hypothetical protein
MKKLTTQFVLDHIDEQFMIGINALYWMGSLHSSMTNVLEEEEFPAFSESFYRRYGSFSPLNPDIAIQDIQEEKCSIGYLDSSIKWEDFVIDVIGFFHHSKCLHDVKKVIKEKFFDHYEYTASANDEQQEAVAKKVLDDYNDTRMLTFFEFRDYMWRWDEQQNVTCEEFKDDCDQMSMSQSHPDDGAVAGPSCPGRHDRTSNT